MRLDQRLLLLLWDLLQLVLLGQDHFGGDAVHPHPVRADLGREVLGEDLHAGLRRRVRDEGVGCARRAAADDMVMMHPLPRSFMPGRKLLMVRKVAVRLVSMSSRQLSSVISS